MANIRQMKFSWSGALLAAMVIVVILSALISFSSDSKPASPARVWKCPPGTVMVETSRYYPFVQPACIAGVYATRK